jgi:hypothetical protein
VAGLTIYYQSRGYSPQAGKNPETGIFFIAILSSALTIELQELSYSIPASGQSASSFSHG